MKPFILLLVLCLIACAGFSQPVDQQKIKVHYFDVGQGASALVEFPCGAILIDAGAQDTSHIRMLIDGIKAFFHRRMDLNNTLDLVIVTHDHKDHDLALKKVVQNFKIKRYVDNGLSDGSGVEQKWLQNHAKELGIEYSNYSIKEIEENNNHQGYTDTIVDPIACNVVDPKIILYCGRFDTQPADWKPADFNEGNNHSLVIKILFGTSSFLFTGDLENVAEKKILDFYANTTVLHADVWEVSHHGADNGTTKEFLDAVKPSFAVISCGHADFGTHPGDNRIFNTFKFGHPRIVTLNLLADEISGARPHPIQVQAATGGTHFSTVTVTKNIYATAWDGDIEIDADTKAHYTIITAN